MAKRFSDQKRLREGNSVQDVLKIFIEGNKLDAGIDNIDVKAAWVRLLGPGIESYTLDVFLKRQTLYVALSSPIVREELSYGKEKIIKMINEDLRKEVVKELILR